MAALPSTLVIPENYYSKLTLRETELAIKEIKDYFQEALAVRLNLQRISAPLFVNQSSGLNDDLNGVERPVSFDMAEHPGDQFQIVHSLAKWKRQALGHYGFEPGEGLYTDMNAIRRDEITDNIHSIYVDQWDWEKVITRRERTLDYLIRQCAPYMQLSAPLSCISPLASPLTCSIFPRRSPLSPLRSWRICIPSCPPPNVRRPMCAKRVRFSSLR